MMTEWAKQQLFCVKAEGGFVCWELSVHRELPQKGALTLHGQKLTKPPCFSSRLAHWPVEPRCEKRRLEPSL